MERSESCCVGKDEPSAKPVRGIGSEVEDELARTLHLSRSGRSSRETRAVESSNLVPFAIIC